MDNMKQLTEIIKVKGKKERLATDIVIRETNLLILLNSYKLVSLACLDDKLPELGLGYLFSEDIIDSTDKIIDFYLRPSPLRLIFQIDLSDKELEQYLSERTKITGCGGGFSRNMDTEIEAGNNTVKAALNETNKTFHPFPFKPVIIPGLMKTFQNFSSLFKNTGGVHSAALVDNQQGEIIYYADDIGRHNAVDKVIGAGIINKKEFPQCSLITTGRVSYEIISKVATMNIPVLISRSAPTSKAISIAYKSKVYLIGFARNNRYNLYSGLNEGNK